MLWVVVIIFWQIYFSNYFTRACPPKCKIYEYKPYIERIKYLVRLPNHKKLNQLALMGTHLSLSYLADTYDLQTQELNLKQQLRYGIRVLDINMRVKFNELYIDFYDHENKIFKATFESVLQELDTFLDDNPGEFIIMLVRRIKNVSCSKKNYKKCNCKIINCYKRSSRGGWRLRKRWTLDDEIGLHRGKILLASLDNSFETCAFNINEYCWVQNIDSVRPGVPHAVSKWLLIADMLNKSYSKYIECFFNGISFYDGQHSRRIIAKDSGYKCQEVCMMPLNYMMSVSFQRFNGLNIVLADFVTQELIDAINDTNFPNSSWRIGWE